MTRRTQTAASARSRADYVARRSEALRTSGERHALVRPASPGQLIAARISRRPWLTLKAVARLAGMKPKRLRGLIADRKKLKWIDIYGLAEALNVHPNGILLVELMEARRAVRAWDEEERQMAKEKRCPSMT